MRRVALFALFALIVAEPAQASFGCSVQPVSGETTTLRVAPFARAPARADLDRGMNVLLDGPQARGWRLVTVAPDGPAGWLRESDLDDCG